MELIMRSTDSTALRRVLVVFLAVFFVVTLGVPGVGVAKTFMAEGADGTEGDPGDGHNNSGGGSGGTLGDGGLVETTPVLYWKFPQFWISVVYADGIPIVIIFPVATYDQEKYTTEGGVK